MSDIISNMHYYAACESFITDCMEPATEGALSNLWAKFKGIFHHTTEQAGDMIDDAIDTIEEQLEGEPEQITITKEQIKALKIANNEIKKALRSVRYFSKYIDKELSDQEKRDFAAQQDELKKLTREIDQLRKETRFGRTSKANIATKPMLEECLRSLKDTQQELNSDTIAGIVTKDPDFGGKLARRVATASDRFNAEQQTALLAAQQQSMYMQQQAIADQQAMLASQQAALQASQQAMTDAMNAAAIAQQAATPMNFGGTAPAFF